MASLAGVTISNRVTTVPPPEGLTPITLSNIKAAIQKPIDVTVALARPKDRASLARMERAERIGQVLQQRLSALLGGAVSTSTSSSCDAAGTTTNHPLVLSVQVVVASEGSRAGRFWAAEFGVGLAKLTVLWKLSSLATTGNANNNSSSSTIYMGSHMHQTSSAGCGFADICQSDAGDRALDNMAEQVAVAIHKYVKDAWNLRN